MNIWSKIRKVGKHKMLLGISGGVVGVVVLCTALAANLGPGAHTGDHLPVTGISTPAPPVVAPVPVPVYPTGAIPYYHNTNQSFYSNVQAMKDSNAYPALSAKIASLSQEPVATWLGEWIGGNSEVQTTVNDIVTKAFAANQMPVVVSYNIPNRDLGQYSAGGVDGPTSYAAWIAAISKGIGDRPAVVVLEPDALAGVPDMSKADGDQRVAMLHSAIQAFATNNPKAYVYVDGGNSKWLDPPELIALLDRVYSGIAIAPRVSLNVSNYRPTAELTTYFKKVNTLYGGKLKALLDTGLNGAANPPTTEDWCNPRGARHGAAEDGLFDPGKDIEQMMVRPLGESSGDCNLGDPDAGKFDAALAATLLGQPAGKYTQ